VDQWINRKCVALSLPVGSCSTVGIAVEFVGEGKKRLEAVLLQKQKRRQAAEALKRASDPGMYFVGWNDGF
jgi:hypothetical protein